jgi:hypothetical protein
MDLARPAFLDERFFLLIEPSRAMPGVVPLRRISRLGQNARPQGQMLG